MFPLQVVDTFLLNYNVGQALLLVFVLVTVGTLPLRSQRLIAINFIAFGLVFLVTPQALVPFHYMFLGLVLLVVGPLMYAIARD